MREEPEREIILRFSSRCRFCGEVLPAGTKALWSKTLGVRCPSDTIGEPTCIDRFFDPSEAP